MIDLSVEKVDGLLNGLFTSFPDIGGQIHHGKAVMGVCKNLGCEFKMLITAKLLLEFFNHRSRHAGVMVCMPKEELGL